MSTNKRKSLKGDIYSVLLKTKNNLEMSLKKSTTTCDYLEFDKTLNMSMKILKNEKNYKIAFLIIVGINSGLRISDILGLHHRDLSGDSLQLVEKKNKKATDN